MPDTAHHERMTAVRDACMAASVPVPAEVQAYFGSQAEDSLEALCSMIKQGSRTGNMLECYPIRSASDIVKLDIIDWNRLNGAWGNSQGAIDTITSWFANAAIVTIWDVGDMTAISPRVPFPKWDHIGAHKELGEAFWHWFHDGGSMGRLCFSDAPDFYGTFSEGARFWGDIGQVSASTFAMTQKQMRAHDFWISVVSRSRQITIEPLVNIQQLYCERLLGGYRGRNG